MSTLLSLFLTNLAKNLIPSTPPLKGAGDVFPNPSAQKQTAIESMIASPDEQATEQDEKEGTQYQKLSSYNKGKKIEVRGDLSEDFETDDIQECRTTFGTVLKNHV